MADKEGGRKGEVDGGGGGEATCLPNPPQHISPGWLAGLDWAGMGWIGQRSRGAVCPTAGDSAHMDKPLVFPGLVR